MTIGTILLIVLLVLSCLHVTYTVTSQPIKNKITGAKQKAAQAEAKAEAQQKQIEQLTIALNKMSGKDIAKVLNND